MHGVTSVMMLPMVMSAMRCVITSSSAMALSFTPGSSNVWFVVASAMPVIIIMICDASYHDDHCLVEQFLVVE